MDIFELKASVEILKQNTRHMRIARSHDEADEIAYETLAVMTDVLGEVAVDIKRIAEAVEATAKMAVIVGKEK